MTITNPIPVDTPSTTVAESRRLLLSCPGCGNSRTVTTVNQAALGALATLQCPTCGRSWNEIITPYSGASQDES